MKKKNQLLKQTLSKIKRWFLLRDSPRRPKLKTLFLSFLFVELLCLSTRLPNLLLQPPHGDEGVYMRWADIIRENPKEWLFISTTEGKQPFFMWMTAFVGYSLSSDPYYGGRIISVFASLISCACCFLLGYLLFSFRAGIFSALFYIFSPYMLTQDRIAMVDSLLNAFSLLTILFTLLLIDKKGPRIITALALGISMGCSYLTKSPGILFITAVGISIIIFSKNKKDVFLWLSFILAYIVAFAIIIPYFVLSPPTIIAGTNKFFHQASHFFSISELLSFPYRTWLASLSFVLAHTKYFHNILLLFLMITVLFHLILGNRGELFLALFVGIYVFIPMLVSKGLNDYRYVLFAFPPLYILAANILDFFVFWTNRLIHFSKTKIAIVLVLLVVSPSFYFVYCLIFSFEKTPFPGTYRNTYIESFWAAYRTPEAISFLKEEIKEKEDIVFLLPVAWGNPSDPVYLYFKKNPKITIHEAWWWPDKNPHLIPNYRSIEMFLSKYQQKNAYILYPESLENKDVYTITNSWYTPSSYVLAYNPEFKLLRSFPHKTHSIDVYVKYGKQ
ncbi:TPA: hypothetical protein DCX16_00970 [bacterium]|nr:hypothetical protein [bacterium]